MTDDKYYWGWDGASVPPSPGYVVVDDKLWDSAVFMLDKELGEMGHECHCEGCGKESE